MEGVGIVWGPFQGQFYVFFRFLKLAILTCVNRGRKCSVLANY